MSLLCFFLLLPNRADAGNAFFRCDGKGLVPIYQEMPCLQEQRSTEIRVLAAPTLTQAEQQAIASANATSGKVERRMRAKQTRTSTRSNHVRRASHARNAKRPRKLRLVPQLYRAGCPETIEQSGSYVVRRSQMQTPSGEKRRTKTSLYDAQMHYKLLPSKTYLKNAGRWPAHCGP